MFVGRGVKISDADFYPLKVALEIFSGGGLSSRLQKIAREKNGLTYGVYGGLANYDKADLIIGSFSTTPPNADQLKNIISDEWQKFGKLSVSEDELAKAKDYLIASEPLRYADIKNLSATMLYMQKQNLGLDFLQKRNTYIQGVKLEDINKIAKKYFTKSNLRFIMMGNFEIQEQKDNENVSR